MVLLFPRLKDRHRLLAPANIEKQIVYCHQYHHIAHEKRQQMKNGLRMRNGNGKELSTNQNSKEKKIADLY